MSSWESGYTVRVLLLWTTMKAFVLALPAASVATSLKLFVPAAKGTPCTHTLPPRSTSPLTVCNVPLLSVYCKATVAVSSSIQACTVKPLPLTWVPACGQTKARAGGVVSPEVSNTYEKFVIATVPAQSVAWIETQLVPNASAKSTHWNQLVTWYGSGRFQPCATTLPWLVLVAPFASTAVQVIAFNAREA